ncbi:MAG: phosphatidylinositol-specific phospholipase C/glycerophosphodiester phosphodiesterase family protein [Planctomycetales bacterium]|nr:phosphatidylinositol-specific phospholipase C/glycerophosphodiester phosphodiesterase family protein [Planctomycetales bacterium]
MITSPVVDVLGPVIAACGMLLLGPATARADDVRPLEQAHAHNDYYHDRPLLDAVDNGFCSIEADVFLDDGELVVAHSRREIDPEKTLEKLYLIPLQTLAVKNGGRIYSNGPSVTLLVDIKTEGESTYKALDQLFQKYADLLTSFSSEVVEQKAVTIVISGNRPEALMKSQARRFAAVDGRLSDLEANKANSLMPVISDRWGTHFNWRGDEPMSNEERTKLNELVRQTHSQGKKLRFWAIPDNQAGWQVMADAGVDFINTDNLAGLRAFLDSRKE